MIINKVKMALLTGALFCLNLVYANTEINIVLIDTKICGKELKVPSFVKLQINHSYDKNKCKNFSLRDKSFHGNLVLNQILSTLTKPKDSTYKIHTYNIFDAKGKANATLWAKVNNKIQKLKSVKLITAAVGVINHKSAPYKLNILTLLASGKSGPFIKKTDTLWPANTKASNSNVVIIGSYHGGGKIDPENYFDHSLLGHKSIDYYFNGKENMQGLKGSSKAVALATTRLLNNCSTSKLGLKSCLKTLVKKIKLFDAPKKLKTFTF